MNSDEVALRCHRAKSWIRKAEQWAESRPVPPLEWRKRRRKPITDL